MVVIDTFLRITYRILKQGEVVKTDFCRMASFIERKSNNQIWNAGKPPVFFTVFAVGLKSDRKVKVKNTGSQESSMFVTCHRAAMAKSNSEDPLTQIWRFLFKCYLWFWKHKYGMELYD